MTRPIRILVVDDGPLMQALVVDALMGPSPEGYDPGRFEVVCASSADEALFIAASDHPDLILVDFVMPEKSGADLVRALREEAVWKPIIGYSASEEGRELLLAGACDFLQKPFTAEALIAAITRVMDRCGCAAGCPCSPTAAAQQQ